MRRSRDLPKDRVMAGRISGKPRGSGVENAVTDWPNQNTVDRSDPTPDERPDSNTVGLVREFYSATSWQYDVFWDSETMHYGHGGLFEFHGSRIENSNKYYSSRLRPSEGDLILDAGCGRGGLAVHLAEEYGCDVVGLDASPYQIERARDNAERSGVDDRVTFVIGSYADCPFPMDAFDGFVAIETICHAPEKCTVVEEMSRVLASGSRFVIGDGFRAEEAVTGLERVVWVNMLEGWALDDLAHRETFAEALRREEFDFEFSNNKGAIWSSSLRLFVLGILGVPLLLVGYLLRLTDAWSLKQGITSLCQFYAFTFDVAEHGDFSGVNRPAGGDVTDPSDVR